MKTTDKCAILYLLELWPPQGNNYEDSVAHWKSLLFQKWYNNLKMYYVERRWREIWTLTFILISFCHHNFSSCKDMFHLRVYYINKNVTCNLPRISFSFDISADCLLFWNLQDANTGCEWMVYVSGVYTNNQIINLLKSTEESLYTAHNTCHDGTKEEIMWFVFWWSHQSDEIL